MSRAAVEYHVAGRADDIRYAEVGACYQLIATFKCQLIVCFVQAERLADILVAMLPDIVIVKHSVHPDDWPEFVRTIKARIGYAHLS